MATTAAEQVSAARAEIENLSADVVATEIENGAVLVDLREADEVAAGMIPSAIHIPRGMLEFRADPTSPYHDDRLDPSKRVVVHCASGGRSALAAKTLKDMGYDSVAHLDGGINAWRDSGRPTPAP